LKVLHISAECFPIAKVGGLADVVGALPKYQNNLKTTSSVVMPFYNNKFTKQHTFTEIYKNTIALGHQYFQFNILKLVDSSLGFELYCVDIKELLFTEKVYTNDDTDRFLAFQIAVLDWILSGHEYPDVLHVHDYHTGLIPFMVSRCYKYKPLSNIPTVLTIHNAQYQGWFSHDKVNLLPPFNFKDVGLLDWDNTVNPLAAAIKCAWRVTTVSPSYMIELKQNANGLENLLLHESAKCVGILNGIDTAVWNPETDKRLLKNYSSTTVISGKKEHKKWLCNKFNLDIKKPLYTFIGRLVGEKGADLFAEIFKEALSHKDISILLLGSGNPDSEKEITSIKDPNFNTYIGYNEDLAHKIYAGSDFLLMPSRVEPCGLNQMYALRYGTVPIVNAIGGLKDTVIDIDNNGFGLLHNGVTTANVNRAIRRASEFYSETKKFRSNLKTIMAIDNSWNNSGKTYVNLYKSLKK